MMTSTYSYKSINDTKGKQVFHNGYEIKTSSQVGSTPGQVDSTPGQVGSTPGQTSIDAAERQVNYALGNSKKTYTWESISGILAGLLTTSTILMLAFAYVSYKTCSRFSKSSNSSNNSNQ